MSNGMLHAGPGSTRMRRPPVSESSQGVMKSEKPGIGILKDILLNVYSLQATTVANPVVKSFPSAEVVGFSCQ